VVLTSPPPGRHSDSWVSSLTGRADNLIRPCASRTNGTTSHVKRPGLRRVVRRWRHRLFPARISRHPIAARPRYTLHSATAKRVQVRPGASRLAGSTSSGADDRPSARRFGLGTPHSAESAPRTSGQAVRDRPENPSQRTETPRFRAPGAQGTRCDQPTVAR
jgi:hypothetical protein